MDEFNRIVRKIKKDEKKEVDCSSYNEDFSDEPLNKLISDDPEGAIKRLNTYVRKIRGKNDLVVFIYPQELRNTGRKSALKTLLKKNRKAEFNAEHAKYRDLLDHPLIVAIVRHKWGWSGALHVLNLILYASFLLLYTTCVLSSTSTDIVSNCYNTALLNDTERSNNTLFSNVENDTIVNSGDTEICPEEGTPLPIVYLKNAVIVFAVIHMVKEVIQIWMYHENYAIMGENLWELFVYITSIMFVVNTSQCNDRGYREVWQWHVGIMSIFVAWICVFLYVPYISGIPIRLFGSIIWKFIRTIFRVLTIFVIAFGIVFHCTLRTNPGFETVEQSLTKTLAMMIGDLDYNGIFIEETPEFFLLGFIFYIAFMYLMAIVMMNIMVGIAVEDVQERQRSSVANDTDLKIQYILFTEPKIKHFLRKFASCCGRYIDAIDKKQGKEYEMINLTNKKETTGLNVWKIKDILHSRDEKTEEQLRFDGIITKFEEVKTQIGGNRTEEQLRFDGIITKFEEVKTQIEGNRNETKVELNKINVRIMELYQQHSEAIYKLKMDMLGNIDSMLQTKMEDLRTKLITELNEEAKKYIKK